LYDEALSPKLLTESQTKTDSCRCKNTE